MNISKEHIALTTIGIISVAALILWIIGVAGNGHGCRGNMMGNQRMMQQDFQQRGSIMKQRLNMKGTGNIQLPTQSAPAETSAE